jgi:membrane protein implicated in regulation of membrane protease activity
VKPWLAYSLIRLGLFAVVLTLLLLLVVTLWIAALVAAAIGVCVAYLFFRPARDKLVESIRTARPRTDDEVAEDGDAQ